jgi:anthranilate phosphoribosyltransferase
MSTTEHSFAQYVRIIGKGKHTHRSLTYEEAYAAFTHILRGEVEDIQLGAFLLLMRVKGEEVVEMAGFAKAAQDFIQAPPITVDIDWPSYAGKHKQQPWYLLAAFLLAANGHRIFMHGSSHQSAGRLFTSTVLGNLGISLCHDWAAVQTQLDTRSFAYAPLSHVCAPLDQLFSWRPLLGVRSPAHSLVKLVNPLKATLGLQSVFHPAYLEIHQQAALLLHQPRTLVMKGEGGEMEFRPDADNRLLLLEGTRTWGEKWNRTQARRQPNLDSTALSAESLRNLWTGKTEDPYGLDAILGTVAMILFAGGYSASKDEAWELAAQYWQNRPPQDFLSH